MLTDEGRIRTTHVGSLPRPAGLIALNKARASIDIVDDGELGNRAVDE